ncbi:MAG: class I SAM-dependent methyltransferase [Siculibacillus sp.]|nr:class I SAM-dependent methyltransferase [Siculibacillus sp.]
MALEGWRRRFGDLAARIGLDRLMPGAAGGGNRFYNCARQGARSWWERTDEAVDLIEKAVAGSTDRRPRVLDLGCGDGKVAVELARRGIEVDYVGFDLHPQSAGVRRLDLARDPIGVEGDVAVVLGVLEYLADPASALKSIAAVVPRLVVSLATSDLDRPATFDPASLNWVYFVDRATFEARLFEAGFRIVERRVTPDRKTALWSVERSA